MYFATGGRGTEFFLAAEIQNKFSTFHPNHFNQELDQVTVREGKVFFNPTSKDLTQCLQTILSLRSAERVFAAIVDYDNSELISDKKAFLDKIMAVLSRKDSYVRTNRVLEALRNLIYFQDKCSHQKPVGNDGNRLFSSHLSSPFPKIDRGKCATLEPEEKRPRLEIGNSKPEKLDTIECATATSTTAENVAESGSNNKPLTFRMSIKCSGKLRKKLDIKRLSRDIGWRVSQASGWIAQLRQPDLEVCVHISDEHVTVGVPLTRYPLSRRNFVQDSGLRAPVAWIMCTLAEMKSGDIILDPMCGKATILLEGVSNWKDNFYIGSDNAPDQIKMAAQNLSLSNSREVNVGLADCLYMPYRSCSVDIVVCDIPFNQNHLISLMPKIFYKRFLKEVCRVLQMDGRCVLLTSQELASLIATLIQSICADISETKVTNAIDIHHQKHENLNHGKAFPGQSPPCTDGTKSFVQSSSNLDHKFCSKTDGFTDSYVVESKPVKEESSFSRAPSSKPNGSENNQNSEKSLSLKLVSQHALKLGETQACILKLIKR